MWSAVNAVLTESAITTHVTGFLNVPAVLFGVTLTMGVGIAVFLYRRARRVMPRG